MITCNVLTESLVSVESRSFVISGITAEIQIIHINQEQI